MADSQFTDMPCAERVAAHPMAVPGYGKRSTHGQAPRTRADFAHLPAREAAIASYLDRLPEGADISVKALAKVLPHGQCALRTALNVLQRTGHLRRGRECVRTGCDGIRWVTRTWFSRTARDDAWWASYAAGTVQEEESGAGEDRPAVEASRPGTGTDRPVRAVGAALATAAPGTTAPGSVRTVPSPRTPVAERSPAYGVLAALGLRNESVTLSADDCDALEPLAAEWFARGWGAEDVLRALTDGLPFPVHHPAGLVRKRLVAKLPPELPPARTVVMTPRVIECGTCREPERPECLVDGDCRACRGERPPAGPGADPEAGAGLSPERVRALAAHVRAGVRSAEQNREPSPA